MSTLRELLGTRRELKEREDEAKKFRERKDNEIKEQLIKTQELWALEINWGRLRMYEKR